MEYCEWNVSKEFKMNEQEKEIHLALISALEQCIPLLKTYNGDKWLETLNLVEAVIKKAKGNL